MPRQARCVRRLQLSTSGPAPVSTSTAVRLLRRGQKETPGVILPANGGPSYVPPVSSAHRPRTLARTIAPIAGSVVSIASSCQVHLHAGLVIPASFGVARRNRLRSVVAFGDRARREPAILHVSQHLGQEFSSHAS